MVRCSPERTSRVSLPSDHAVVTSTADMLECTSILRHYPGKAEQELFYDDSSSGSTRLQSRAGRLDAYESRWREYASNPDSGSSQASSIGSAERKSSWLMESEAVEQLDSLIYSEKKNNNGVRSNKGKSDRTSAVSINGVLPPTDSNKYESTLKRLSDLCSSGSVRLTGEDAVLVKGSQTNSVYITNSDEDEGIGAEEAVPKPPSFVSNEFLIGPADNQRPSRPPPPPPPPRNQSLGPISRQSMPLPPPPPPPRVQSLQQSAQHQQQQQQQSVQKQETVQQNEEKNSFWIPRPKLIVPVHTFGRKRRTGNLYRDNGGAGDHKRNSSSSGKKMVFNLHFEI
jgi:hypothetical protein